MSTFRPANPPFPRARPAQKIAAAIFAVLVWIPGARAQSGADSPMRDAMAALSRGDFRAAEKTLRTELAAHPNDAWTMSLLGAALDNLKRPAEADALHRKAVAAAPGSVDVLNNFAAHLWLSGKEQEAAKVYRQIIAIEPSHPGANLQLAQRALKDGSGSEALACLDRLAAAERERPRALLPRLQALYLTGDRGQADALAARLLEMARTDPDLAFAAGATLSSAQQFAQAEIFFESALKSDPANFNLLYNVGVAAARAGHSERAREVLEAALRQQPRNVDTLYALACADHSLRQWERAMQLLAEAAKLDPRRADVQKMLAVAAMDLGALDDAYAAWERYLKLAPGDDVGRRERGYTAAQRGHLEEGLADLRWFTSRHPNDAVGHYELAQAERSADMAAALGEYDRAVAADPRFVPALTARGSLYYQMGKPEQAVKDLENAAVLNPDDAANLDRLGQTYQALDRTADALRVLRRAAELAPDNSKTLLHFARALADAGNTDESKAVMDRFRLLGPEKQAGVRAGFVEYLSLSEAQRHADYKARLERALRDHPNDPGLRVDRMKLLLAEGSVEKAVQEAHGIAAMKPGPATLADAGRALLGYQNYAVASELLKQARDAGAPQAVALDLSLAERLKAAESAAEPAAKVLSRLDEAVEMAPERPEIYRDAAAILVRKGDMAEAARLLDGGARRLPGNREILLLQAIAAELAGKTADAESSLSRIRDRWPEWRAGWMAHGIVLDRRGRFQEAEKLLETAAALGEQGPGAAFYLADSAAALGKLDVAEAHIREALRLAPDDPWVVALAGSIALKKGDRAGGIDRLRRAIQLRPELVEPHRELARAYRAEGRTAEAQAEEAAAARLQTGGSTQDPPYLFRLFSSVEAR